MNNKINLIQINDSLKFSNEYFVRIFTFKMNDKDYIIRAISTGIEYDVLNIFENNVSIKDTALYHDIERAVYELEIDLYASFMDYIGD